MYNWSMVKTLKRLTYFQLVVLLPAFIFVTVKGSEIFAFEDLGQTITGISETYPFLIFWFLFSYITIISYFGLIIHGYDQVH